MGVGRTRGRAETAWPRANRIWPLPGAWPSGPPVLPATRSPRLCNPSHGIVISFAASADRPAPPPDGHNSANSLVVSPLRVWSRHLSHDPPRIGTEIAVLAVVRRECPLRFRKAPVTEGAKLYPHHRCHGDFPSRFQTSTVQGHVSQSTRCTRRSGAMGRSGRRPAGVAPGELPRCVSRRCNV